MRQDEYYITTDRHAEFYESRMKKRDAFFRLARIVIGFIAVSGSIIGVSLIVYWSSNNECFLK